MELKKKKVFYCTDCGQEYPKWQGVCNSCGQWNTIEEQVILQTKSKSLNSLKSIVSSKPIQLTNIDYSENHRIDMEDPELNRILGGGLVSGSFILLGGEPGIGKSTLILQTILKLKSYKTLYVSGEESPSQLKMRANRIYPKAGDNCFIYCQTNLDSILSEADIIKPDIIVIDSIQTIHTNLNESSLGNITQIRYVAGELLRYAKTRSTPIIVVGHITKDGSIAGPKLLEHMVDVVLQFDGDKHYIYRILRVQKNRFGSTSELGIYEMDNIGLKAVKNPSENLIRRNTPLMSGIAIAVAMEGIRTFLIEVQSLVSSAVYPSPQRSTTGFDIKRMNMLLAVLEKRAGFKLVQKDVFLNIAGGLKINDPSIDLAVITSVLSSSIDMPLPKGVCFSGEVGLSGEVRPISRIDQRIKEAERLGFDSIIIPYDNIHSLNKDVKYRIRIIGVSTVEESFKLIFKSK